MLLQHLSKLEKDINSVRGKISGSFSKALSSSFS